MWRGIIGMAIIIVCLGIVVVWYWNICSLERDTQKFLIKAQAAVSVADMKKYLLRLQEGMEKRKMTEGHVVWTKSPQNEMKEIYGEVVRINKCFQALSRSNNAGYLITLAGLKKDVAKFQLHHQGWFIARNWRWLIWLPICIVMFFVVMLL